VLADANVAVTFGTRDAAKGEQAAAAIGKGVRVASVREAAARADVVVLAVPYAQAANAIREAGGLADKIVVDITNPPTADYMGLTIGHTTSAAEEIQKLVPRAKVVKAFNTVFAQVLAAGSRIGGKPVSVFIAGDDEAATKAVGDIVARAGFEAVQVGALKFARYLEPLGGLNIVLGYGRGFGTAIAPTWLRG
jgi:predicted dinucleotide-binding enzyme